MGHFALWKNFCLCLKAAVLGRVSGPEMWLLVVGGGDTPVHCCSEIPCGFPSSFIVSAMLEVLGFFAV